MKIDHRPLVKSEYQKLSFFISQPKHMLWVLKKRLSETVLLSTKNICYYSWVRKYLHIYAEFIGLSKPVDHKYARFSVNPLSPKFNFN